MALNQIDGEHFSAIATSPNKLLMPLDFYGRRA